MNRKKLVSIGLAVILISGFSLSGCSEFTMSTMLPVLKIDRGPYVPFAIVDEEIPSIDHPVQSWTYHWPEDYSKVLEAETEPLVDDDGNVYFLGKNRYFYLVNTNGELIWDIPFNEDITTAPSLDSDGNIYLGIMSSHFHNNIYSFYPDGTSRWVLEDIDVASEFKSNNLTCYLVFIDS
ncbi:MAG: hypothetical protein KAH01_05570 [Caldisericia bacterium]|nr:hypothetical protein [Caldisericia bacterium]